MQNTVKDCKTYPNRLSLSECNGGIKSIVEGLISSADIVGLGVLKVWVGIHGDKVTSLHDRSVGSINIGSPRIDVSYWSSHPVRCKVATDLVDVVDKGGRVRTGT